MSGKDGGRRRVEECGGWCEDGEGRVRVRERGRVGRRDSGEEAERPSGMGASARYWPPLDALESEQNITGVCG